MLYNINLEKILFLDIETVPMTASFDELPQPFRKHWELKSERIRKSAEETPEELFHRAGIYAEFGNIICISTGYLRNGEFRIKSFFGDDEKQVLSEFADLLNRYFHNSDQLLCAHNGKEFDFPYLSRRMLIRGIRLPSILDTSGKKPWEVNHLDTMELWKFGDFKNYTSLDLLAAVLNIPSPKEDIDGSKVWEVYYKDHDLDRIVNYCQRDTLTVAQILLRYVGKPFISEEKIIFT